MQFRVTPCGGWDYAPALQAGNALRWGLGIRGIGAMRPLCGIQHGGNRKSQGALARLCEFPGISPLNPLRTPSPPLKRAGTPCTRERGLRLGLTALRGASEGWGYGLANQCSVFGIRNASLPDSCLWNRFAMGVRGLRLGLCPKPQQGTSFPAPFLRFAAVLSHRQKIPPSAIVRQGNNIL